MATGTWGPDSTLPLFRVTIRFTRGSQQCQTGFHLRDVGLADQSPEQVVNAVDNWVTTQFIKTLHTADHITGLDAENIITREGFAKSYTNVVGLMSDLPAPSFITVPISIKGSIRRRYGNGRMLWPVGGRAYLDGNTLTAGATTSYSDALTALAGLFIGSAVTHELLLVHLHDVLPPRGSRNTPVPATWYDATSLRLNNVTSALKRRKIGHGA